MTPASAKNRVHIRHRPDYARIIEFLKNKGLRNGNFTCADVGVHWKVIKALVNSGSLVKAGKNAKHNNIYRLAYNIDKEVNL